MIKVVGLMALTGAVALTVMNGCSDDKGTGTGDAGTGDGGGRVDASSAGTASAGTASAGGDASAGTASAGSDGGSSDGGSGGSDGGTTGDGGAAVNGCTTYVDRTGGNDARTITWDFNVAGTPEHCMKIKQGQSVTWSTPSSTHPLVAFNGATPSPISSTPVTVATTTAFPNVGIYGYKCNNHGSMLGAIEVVP